LWAKSKRNKEILWMENSLHWPLLFLHRDGQKWQTDTIFRPQGWKITSSKFYGHYTGQSVSDSTTIKELEDFIGAKFYCPRILADNMTVSYRR